MTRVNENEYEYEYENLYDNVTLKRFDKKTGDTDYPITDAKGIFISNDEYSGDIFWKVGSFGSKVRIHLNNTRYTWTVTNLGENLGYCKFVDHWEN